MKKFLISVLCLVMVLSLAACSDDTKDAVTDAAQNAKDGVENVADSAKNDVADALKDAGEKVSEKAEDALDGAKDKLEGAGEKINDALDAAGDKINDALDAAGDKIDDAIDAAGDKVEDVLDGTEDAGEKAEDAVMGGLAGIANPMVAADSLEALNEKMGCNMVKPAVMGVTDEAFYVISDAMAEYRFTVGGYDYTLRCQGTMDDICGIYGDNGTLFEGKTEEELYAEGSGYKAKRWFTTDGQYVLTINDNGAMSEEQFLSIADEIEEGTRPEIIMDSEGVFYEINGDFQDTYSGRAMAEVVSADDSAEITVRWGDSASVTYVWNMTVTFDDGQFVYSDCTETKETAEEDGTISEELISGNESGYFTYKEGMLFWDGAADENCKNCVFEKMIEE